MYKISNIIFNITNPISSNCLKCNQSKYKNIYDLIDLKLNNNNNFNDIKTQLYLLKFNTNYINYNKKINMVNNLFIIINYLEYKLPDHLYSQVSYYITNQPLLDYLLKNINLSLNDTLVYFTSHKHKLQRYMWKRPHEILFCQKCSNELQCDQKCIFCDLNDNPINMNGICYECWDDVFNKNKLK